MSQLFLSTTLGALRQTGSVIGVLLTRGHEILYQNSDLTEVRVAELASLLDDIAYYFEQEKRAPDQLAFGYDGGNLLLQLRGDLRLVVLYREVEETDFIIAASVAFLKDYEMGVLINAWTEKTSLTKP